MVILDLFNLLNYKLILKVFWGGGDSVIFHLFYMFQLFCLVIFYSSSNTYYV
jgi:hypothetical protein